jgi:predicted alpha/beta-hydrolase family hydrolase
MMTVPAAATWRIRAGNDETTAAWDPPAAGVPGPVFICAHGAGGHLADKAVVAMTTALQQCGVGTVRFNFYYRARGSGRPDPMPRLLECWHAVVAHVRSALNPDCLVLGGRSMGGRAASMAVSEGLACQGLLLLAYPLHPPGQPDKLRTAHLAQIDRPVLCLSGTRDAFCDRALMEQVLAGLGHNWRMHWLEGADHGFHVLKRSGRTDRDIVAEAADECRPWLASL